MAVTLHSLKRYAFTEQIFPLFLYISHPSFCIFLTPTFCIFLRLDSALGLANTQFFAIATHSTILGADESPTFCIFLWSTIPLTPCKYSIFAQIPPRARPQHRNSGLPGAILSSPSARLGPTFCIFLALELHQALANTGF